MTAIASWVDGGTVDPVRAGHKAVSLAAMAAAGLPVPRGFVVLAEVVDSADDELPRAVADEITSAYRALGSPVVAVRSSATAEDLEGASFAGQYDTVLGVRGDKAVRDAVITVRRSLRSERAVAYRRARGMAEDGLAMAVIVQELVPADAAGVLFTRHPLSGDESVVMISAARGLGEGVVDGTALTDTYTLDAATGAVIERELAGDTAVLDDRALDHLLELARRVREVFGGHRDVEFAVQGGAVHALQARPITALDDGAADFPVRWDDPADADRSWMLRSAAPVHLLEVDIQRASAERMRVGFGETGVPMMHLHVWQVINGYLYVTGPDVAADVVAERQARLTALHDRYAATGSSVFEEDVEPLLVARLAELARLRARRRSLAGRVELLERAIAAYADAMGNLHWRIQAQPVDWPARYAELTGRPAIEAVILLQAVTTRTTRLINHLRRLAKVVQTDPALLDVFDRRDWPALEGLDDGTAVRSFRAGFSRLLRDYGLRTGMGLGGVANFLSPTWSMSPSIPLGIIASYARQDLDELDRRDRRLRAQRQRLERAIEADLAGDPDRWQRFELARRHMVNAARTTEDHNHLMEQACGGSMREAALLTGQALVAGGRLDDPDDVFHLSLTELRALAAGHGPTDTRGLVHERKAVRSKQGATRPPRTLGAPATGPGGPGAAFTPPEGAGLDGDVLRGTAASRGRHTGRARVAPPEHAPPDVRPGDILVASMVGEAWTPIFPLLGGLVLDYGGIFQHAAVVAREYGIPAVMMTRDATKTIADGQLITVDGDAGIVELAPG